MTMFNFVTSLVAFSVLPRIYKFLEHSLCNLNMPTACFPFCACINTFARTVLYNMRGGRTFLTVAPHLLSPTVTEITGCYRTDCSLILNRSFWLL